MDIWFVHEWEFHAAIGAIALIVALAASWAERRRLRRTNLDAVGFMPWTTVYLIAFLAAIVLLGLAMREWFAG
ncbi:hypothetical protein [Novosphingobium sp. CECT 9465]|uniref:hypothetical protein n=1 Tax=Novosphingobium sp. CECT 9465 TaxID=2829794 RepID=UPI001E5F4FCF|nr:hypothetical protein [Novosphingobium sp. CECT 9465]